MADFSITLLDFTFFFSCDNEYYGKQSEKNVFQQKKKGMPRAGFEPTISSLLVTRLTNLAIKAWIVV